MKELFKKIRESKDKRWYIASFFMCLSVLCIIIFYMKVPISYERTDYYRSNISTMVVTTKGLTIQESIIAAIKIFLIVNIPNIGMLIAYLLKKAYRKIKNQERK